MPQEEVAISQLAVLENFAEHGLYVKFDDSEAAALETQALEHALRESAAEAAAAPSAAAGCSRLLVCAAPSAPSHPRPAVAARWQCACLLVLAPLVGAFLHSMQ
jgi:hypothetical protein